MKIFQKKRNDLVINIKAYNDMRELLEKDDKELLKKDDKDGMNVIPYA